MDSSSSTFFLLVPRVRVKADWPEMHQRLLKVGDILIQDRGNYRNTRNSELTISVSDAARFPHLFESLPWHAERKPEEMPEYVKYNRQDDGRLVVAKVNDYEKRMDGSIIAWCEGNLSFPLGKIDYPATEAEYNAYLQSQTN